MPSRKCPHSFRFSVSRFSEGHQSAPPNKTPEKVVIAVAVTGVALFVVLVFVLLLWYHKLVRSNARKGVGVSCNLRKFSYKELKRATSCFHQSQKLGKGGFGIVYRGVLRNGKEVAVKKLVLSSVQGEREFQNELSICNLLDSRHVVKLLGFSTHGENVRLLVYELMHNRSLQETLLEKNLPLQLDWEKRFNIILDVARALAYLHLECDPPIIHGDVKPSNVLLDSNFSARIADFGLARLKTEDLVSALPVPSEKLGPETPDRAAQESPQKISQQGFHQPETAARRSVSKAKSIQVETFPSKNDGGPNLALELPVAFQDGRECADVESFPSSCAGSPHVVARYLSDSQGDSEIPCSMILPLGRGSFPGVDTGCGTDVAPSKDVLNGEVRNVSDSTEPLPPARKSPHKAFGGKDWWWRQEHSVEVKVKDYVMEWMGSEVAMSDRKAESGKCGNAAEGFTEARGSKSEQGSGDAKGRKEKTKGRSKGTRKSREWWKDEYFAELSRKEEASLPERGKGRGKRRKGEQAAVEGAESRGSRRTNSRSDGNSLVLSGDKGGARQRDAAGGELPSDGERQSGGDLSRDVSSATSMRGTVCYVAPEYGGGAGGLPLEPSDVYSFGVLMLVIISGRRPIEFNPNPAAGVSPSSASPLCRFQRANLISWARRLAYSGNLFDLVDQHLGSYDREQVYLCITLALLCIQRVPTTRPTIADVVKILLGELPPPPFPLEFSPSPPSRISYHSPLRAASLVSSED